MPTEITRSEPSSPLAALLFPVSQVDATCWSHQQSLCLSKPSRTLAEFEVGPEVVPKDGEVFVSLLFKPYPPTCPCIRAVDYVLDGRSGP
jgi:hypothetical protein